MKKWFAAIAAVVAVAGVAGCGDSSDDASAPPSASPSRDMSKPLMKKVGEPAYWGCEGPDDKECSLEFTVTSIEPVATTACDDYTAERIKPTDRLVRVKVDAQAKRPIKGLSGSPAAVLNTQFWGGVSADGYTTAADTQFGCIENGSPSTYGAFYTTVPIGGKSRGEMVFSVPKDSTKLYARYFESPGWEWNLPEEKSAK